MRLALAHITIGLLFAFGLTPTFAEETTVGTIDAQGCPAGSSMPGGWKERDSSEPDVKEAADAAFSQLAEKLNTVYNIKANKGIKCARSQVVAGINYRFTLIVEGTELGEERQFEPSHRAFDVIAFKPLPYTKLPIKLSKVDDQGDVGPEQLKALGIAA